jgi:hypothetical protein
MGSLVIAANVWGVTAFDICCFRGVTALATTTHGEALGFRHQYLRILVFSDFEAL